MVRLGMSFSLQRASVLAAALACVAGPVSAQAGPEDGWLSSALELVSPPQQLAPQRPSPQVAAFLATVKEFAQPGLQSDAGLLIYPTDSRSPPSALPQPQVAYEPDPQPAYVRSYFRVAPRRLAAPVFTYSTPIGRNGPPSLAVQMQRQSQVVTRGNGEPSQAVRMQQQQQSGSGGAPYGGQRGSQEHRPQPGRG